MTDKNNKKIHVFEVLITVNRKKFYSHTIFRLYTSGKFFIVKYINICIIYLRVIETCLKVTIATFYFYPSKNPSDVMKNIFNAISIYSWKKKSSLTNIRNKRVIRKKYVYCFDVMKNGHTFPSKICHFQYDHRFLFSREMGNSRACNEVRLQKLIKLRLLG